jgi:glycosidase
MLDGVFNHCGWDHPFFQDVIKNGKKSPYWSCFFIESEPLINFPLDQNGRPAVYNLTLNYRTFAKTPFMPKLNTGDPLMEQYLLDVATYWVREYDIDGWRLDVSNEVSHAFWRKFRQAVRAVKSDVYIIGENWDDSNSWLRGDQFDAVMNYEVSYPVWQFLAKVKNPNPITAEQFVSRINSLLVAYPKTVSVNMFNLVGSHDTMRILTRMGNDPRLVKLAYLFIFAFCGSPAIYYGDEVGLAGKEDPDCRRCMLWNETEQDRNLFAFFKRLIAIRKQNHDWELPDILWHHHADHVLVFQKGETFVFLNNNPEPTTVAVPESIRSQNGKNLMTGRQSPLPDNITLAEYGFLITKIQ